MNDELKPYTSVVSESEEPKDIIDETEDLDSTESTDENPLEKDMSVATSIALSLLQWCVNNDWFKDGFYISNNGIRVIKQDIIVQKDKDYE